MSDLIIGGTPPATDCDCLASKALPACITSIRFLTEVALTDIWVYVSDKWGNTWQLEITTDADSYATIVLADLPTRLAVLLNPYSGMFKLWATLKDEPLTAWINIIVQETAYLCVFLTFDNFEQDFDTITL